MIGKTKFAVNDIRVTAEQMNLIRARAKEFGFVPLDNALSEELLAGLRTEAFAQRAIAQAAVGTDAIPYKSHIGELGDCAQTFLKGSSVAHLLQKVFEQSFVLSERASCYTYYGPGSFLGRHRDRPVECAATLIVYLDAASPNPDFAQTGLSLRVFGEDGEGTVEPRAVIPTRAGMLVVGRGSKFWHERTVLQPGEHVIALTACFGVFDSSKPGTA